MLKKSVMSLNNTTILITGGLGQIGLAILHALQKRYPTAHLHVLDLQIPGIEDVRYLEGVKYHKGDIANRDAVGGLMGEIKPGVIFHTAGLIPQIAARLGLDTREGYMGVNVEGTRILLDEAGRVGSVRCFVFTSSADVVKGNSWQDLKGVGEDMPIPGVFDGWYAESKVRTAIPSRTLLLFAFPRTSSDVTLRASPSKSLNPDLLTSRDRQKQKPSSSPLHLPPHSQPPPSAPMESSPLTTAISSLSSSPLREISVSAQATTSMISPTLLISLKPIS